MTRQDYELIAKVIWEWEPISPIPEWVKVEIRQDLATDMANALVRTNPRFNRERFILAATTGGN